MITLTINGLPVSVEEGTTLLEAARFLGFPIPTLCHMDGLSPYGACRLCVVEIGEGPKAKLVSSCTYPAEKGSRSDGVIARHPGTQDDPGAPAGLVPAVEDDPGPCLGLRGPSAALPAGVRGLHPLRPLRAHVRGADDGQGHRLPRARRETEHRHALRHQVRGLPAVRRLHVRLPACQLRCTYTEPEKAICGGCANLSPPCLEKEQFDDMMCSMAPCVACEIKKD